MSSIVSERDVTIAQFTNLFLTMLTRPTLIATLVLTALSLSAHEKSADIQNDVGIQAAGKKFIWRASQGKSVVYLLGSIHVGQPDWYPLAPVIEDAFAASNIVVLEVDPLSSDNITAQIDMVARSTYSGGASLRDDIGDDIYKQLLDYLSSNQLPTQPYINYRPGFLAFLLAAQKTMQLGYSPFHGIDYYFANRARGKKTIVELESVDQQIALIIDLPDPALHLEDTLSQLPTFDQFLADTIAAWTAGDAAGLATREIDQKLHDHPEYAPLYKRLLFDRNQVMATRIKQFLTTANTYFVIVGSAHIVGDNGIVSHLRRAGIAVNQLAQP